MIECAKRQKQLQNNLFIAYVCHALTISCRNLSALFCWFATEFSMCVSVFERSWQNKQQKQNYFTFFIYQSTNISESMENRTDKCNDAKANVEKRLFWNQLHCIESENTKKKKKRRSRRHWTQKQSQSDLLIEPKNSRYRCDSQTNRRRTKQIKEEYKLLLRWAIYFG